MNTHLKSKFSRHIRRVLDYLDDESLPKQRQKDLVKGELWTLHNDLQAGNQAFDTMNAGDGYGNRLD